MSLIAAGSIPSLTPSADQPADEPIQPDVFWPPVSLSELRKVQRVDDNVTNERALFELRAAIFEVNFQLFLVQSAAIEAGSETFGEVYVSSYDLERMTHQYKLAVYSEAKARLLENYRDISSTALGAARAEDMIGRIKTCRVRVVEAVRAIQGKPRLTAELI